MRYNIFLKYKNEFENLDYLIFFNANTLFVDYIFEKEFLPNEENDNLVSVHHSGHYIMDNKWDGYDETQNSLSYIPKRDRVKKYCQGCLIGGKTNQFLEMCQEISNQIDIDLLNNIYPSYWDEPYMNKYLSNKNPLILNPGYSFPDNTNAHTLMENIKIYALQLDKNNFGGHNFLRN
jgi:hypothetical protein